ncbi:PucR family transcriptional regulator [Pseudonocardia endophytica]|uniref:Sugar diacid utilization regulator n=1 Tax=Pseudonocardia endophytica TaxID=401976 RepID=A0A4R1HXN5_PSEEN|nr:helix-turn-helix domain-containing protein [Pseudonocardia endophytica]TCK26273.1 sugar diacid utilization regulator [Pseudonocardia endophytica]
MNAVAIDDPRIKHAGVDGPQPPAPELSPWELRTLERVHEAIHLRFPGVLGCCYAAIGCPAMRLCALHDLELPAIFGRLGSSGHDSGFSVEAHADSSGTTRFVATAVIARDGRTTGRVQFVASCAPDVAALSRIVAVAVQEAENDLDGVLDGGAPAEEKALRLDPAAQETLIELFEADPGTQPTVRCLLQRVSAALGSAVAVQTARGVVIGSAGRAEPVLLNTSSHRDSDAIARAARSSTPVFTPGSSAPFVRAVVKIGVGGAHPYLLVAEVDRRSAWSIAVLRQAAGILSWLLRMEQDATDDITLRRSAIVADLMRGADLASVPARAAVLGHDLSGPHRALAFTAARAASETDLVRVGHALADRFRNAGGGNGPDTLVSTIGPYVIALVPDTGNRESETDARLCLTSLRRDGFQLVCGIGPSASGPEALSEGLDQAVRAADILRDHDQRDAVTYYEDLGLLGFLYSDSDRHRLHSFVSRWLGPLHEHDDSSNSELLRTVEAVVDHPTLNAAANALYIHISTLKYRCKRIEEVLGADLRDPEVTFNLRLAMKLSSIQQKLGTRSS